MNKISVSQGIFKASVIKNFKIIDRKYIILEKQSTLDKNKA